MTKTAALLLGTGIVAVVIAIVLLIMTYKPKPEPAPELRAVEIIAPKGTQASATLLDEGERNLGDLIEASLTVHVAVNATIILRYNNKEKTFPPSAWEKGKIVWQPESPARPPRPPATVSLSINAVPWAEVFIKLPNTTDYIKPRKNHFTIRSNADRDRSNVTPIRGGLSVPVGTSVMLTHGSREKIFGYEAWKTSKVISHDFLSP